jgi:STE24 endopeptidase
MDPEKLFTIIVAIVIFNYVFSRILEYLNSRRYGAPIPAELDDVYDKEKYKKSMAYKKVNYRFAILTGTFSLALILLMLFYSGFAFADDLVRSVTDHPILVALLFFGLLMLGLDLINIPFSAYDTFVIEERFGFNKTTVKTFITDRIKSWMLGAIIGGGILAAIIWFYILTGKNFWIFAWILISVYTIFMYMFYSNLIVPLFNKQTPLEEGELRDAITEFSNKAGFKLKNIFVIYGCQEAHRAVRHLDQ